MTLAEQIAEKYAKHGTQQFTPGLPLMTKGAMCDAINEAIERCIKAQCRLCERGVELVDIQHRLRDGLVPKGIEYREVQCGASRIRALKGQP